MATDWRACRYAIKLDPATFYLEYETHNSTKSVRAIKLKQVSTALEAHNLASKVIRSFPRRIDRSSVSYQQVLLLVQRLLVPEGKPSVLQLQHGAAAHAVTKKLGSLEDEDSSGADAIGAYRPETVAAAPAAVASASPALRTETEREHFIKSDASVPGGRDAVTCAAQIESPGNSAAAVPEAGFDAAAPAHAHSDARAKHLGSSDALSGISSSADRAAESDAQQSEQQMQMQMQVQEQELEQRQEEDEQDSDAASASDYDIQDELEHAMHELNAELADLKDFDLTDNDTPVRSPVSPPAATTATVSVPAASGPAAAGSAAGGSTSSAQPDPRAAAGTAGSAAGRAPAAAAAAAVDGDEALVLELDLADGELDLNKASEYELQLAKAKMDAEFQRNQVKPTDPDYVYDKQVEFGPATSANDWDEPQEQDERQPQDLEQSVDWDEIHRSVSINRRSDSMHLSITGAGFAGSFTRSSPSTGGRSTSEPGNPTVSEPTSSGRTSVAATSAAAAASLPPLSALNRPASRLPPLAATPQLQNITLPSGAAQSVGPLRPVVAHQPSASTTTNEQRDNDDDDDDDNDDDGGAGNDVEARSRADDTESEREGGNRGPMDVGEISTDLDGYSDDFALPGLSDKDEDSKDDSLQWP